MQYERLQNQKPTGPEANCKKPNTNEGHKHTNNVLGIQIHSIVTLGQQP